MGREEALMMVILPPREDNLRLCTSHPLNEGQPLPMCKTSMTDKESLYLKTEILHRTTEEACDLRPYIVNCYESSILTTYRNYRLSI